MWLDCSGRDLVSVFAMKNVTDENGPEGGGIVLLNNAKPERRLTGQEWDAAWELRAAQGDERALEEPYYHELRDFIKARGESAIFAEFDRLKAKSEAATTEYERTGILPREYVWLITNTRGCFVMLTETSESGKKHNYVRGNRGHWSAVGVDGFDHFGIYENALCGGRREACRAGIAFIEECLEEA